MDLCEVGESGERPEANQPFGGTNENYIRQISGDGSHSFVINWGAII